MALGRKNREDFRWQWYFFDSLKFRRGKAPPEFFLLFLKNRGKMALIFTEGGYFVEYAAKRIALPNGKTVLFRAPTPADSPAMIEYLELTAGETDFLSRRPGERHMTVEQEEGYLRSVLDSPGQVMIVCEADGILAGNCQAVRGATEKTAHRATFMIGLRKAYWHMGIGSRMFDELIALAAAMGCTQAELRVMAGNTRAQGLYRKKGFRVVGEIPNAFRMLDGSYEGELYMVRPLP